MRTAILLNPRSGSAPTEPELARALDAAGLTAAVHCLPADAALRTWVDGLAPAYDVLVAAGGDGTVSTVAAAAVTLRKTFGVIPAGTLNHFARDAGIPTDLDAAIDVLASGQSRLFDVGTVNGSIFINNASIGAYPRMVWERNRARQNGTPRPIAAGLAVMRTWLELRPITVHLRVDDDELIRRSPFVFVGNGEYEVEGTQFGRRRTLTGGTLALYVTPESGRLDSLALPLRALLGTLKTHDKFETWRASVISVETAVPLVSVALDGEIAPLESPLRFAVRRDALRTIVPAVEPH